MSSDLRCAREGCGHEKRWHYGKDDVGLCVHSVPQGTPNESDLLMRDGSGNVLCGCRAFVPPASTETAQQHSVGHSVDCMFHGRPHVGFCTETAEPRAMIPNPRRSVLQDWVMELPLREQGTLLTAVRGCDLTPKYPLDSIERRLVACIRGAFMVAADEREVDKENGSFMSRRIPCDWKPSALGHYPQHWVSHVMHASEVLGYRHPDPSERYQWRAVYEKLCDSFHVPCEPFDVFEARMSEDRIASGEVVS